MSKARKIAVLLFVAVLTFSMFMAPVGPVARAEKAPAPVLSPKAQEQVEQWYEELAQPGFTARIDPLLAEWMETGDLSDMVVTKQNGDIRALVVASPNVDVDAVKEIVNVDWFVDLVIMKSFAVSVSSPDQLNKLAELKGVGIIDADVSRVPIKDDLAREIDSLNLGTRAVDMDIIKEVVDADTASSTFNVNGSGVTVGLIDTGTDFGNPVLQDAYSIDSYDPTGEGLTFLQIANTTPVDNITEWVAAGNLLTYTNASGTFLNVTGWDPLLNNGGSPRYLYGDGDPSHPYYSRVGFIWLYAYYWGIDMGDILDYIIRDWKLPDPSNVNGNYTVNWVFQQHSSPYAKVFAPCLVYNSTADKQYKLIINWEDAAGFTDMWDGAIYYEAYDLTDNATRDAIVAQFDWDFTDDEVFDLTNPVVAADMNGDGVDDFSLGALAWLYDGSGWFDDDPMFHGFRDDGMAFGLLTDDGNHGTATASHIAAQGMQWYNEDNKSYFNMEGIAPGAKIMSVRALSGLADYGAYLWVCGFDLNETSGEFYYTGNHKADLVSNSWGWVTEPSSQFDYLSLTWEVLSSPGILDPSYEGVLHVFSAGNEGAGYMTIGPPGSAAGVLTVGASTSSHWLEYLYGPDQMDYESIASFSSRGPSFDGYPKPDVVAPGLAGYAAIPWYYSYFAGGWSAGPWWNPAYEANYTLFAGTSQAAPVAAGVVALLVEALNDNSVTWTAPMLKTIIQSTATDLGYNPAEQGFGRVDAYDAIDFVVNGGLVGATVDSYNYFMQLLGDAWAYWGILPSSIMGYTVNNTATPLASDIYDGGIYFGEVYPSDTATVHYNVYTAAGNMFDTPEAYAGLGAQSAYYFIEGDTFTFTDVTFSYNDTVMKDEQMYGYYNLSAAIGSAFDTALANYNYMTVAVSFDPADLDAGNPWMFLYDWEDVNGDGMPNLWNATSGQGNELTRITSASDDGNTNIIPFGVTAANFEAVLEGNLTLVIHDPLFDTGVTWWNTTGNPFTCTVTFWDTTPAPIVFADGGASYSVNITYTAPTEYGIHTGYVMIGSLMVPWSVMVKANISAAEGEVNTIVPNTNTELRPYDNAVWGCMESDPDDWDFRTYAIHVPHENASYLGVRVIWDNTGNDMYVAVLDNTNFILGEGSAKTPTTTAVLAEIDGIGDYYLFMHPIGLNGTDRLPVNYTLEVMWYESLTAQDVILSYTANDVTEAQAVADGDTLVGDHVVINATYPEFNLPNMPEFEVSDIQIGFLSGIFFDEVGTLVIPDSNYNPFSGAPVQLDQFAWMKVDGIKEGDNVAVTVDFTNGDCDIMAWWADTDNSTWTYNNNLLGDQMATGAKPEHGSFTADRSGSVMFGIFDYDLEEGSFELIVDTRVGVYESADGASVTYDTYQFLKNGTFQVQIVADTETNIGFEVNLAALTFQNFFAPKLTGVDVSVSGATVTLTWNATDKNAGDDLYYEVLLSSDGGLTYQLLSKNLTDTTYTWDSTGFYQKDTYRFMVRVYDNDPTVNPSVATGYWMGLSDSIESDTFTAGTVPVPTPTTTPPPETTTTTPVTGGLDPMILGLIAGVGVGVVVVLILFLVKKR